MSGQSGVFARQDASLVGHKLLQKIDVLVVQGIDGEVNLGLGTLGADLGRTGATVPG